MARAHVMHVCAPLRREGTTSGLPRAPTSTSWSSSTKLVGACGRAQSVRQAMNATARSKRRHLAALRWAVVPFLHLLEFARSAALSALPPVALLVDLQILRTHGEREAGQHSRGKRVSMPSPQRARVCTCGCAPAVSPMRRTSSPASTSSSPSSPPSAFRSSFSDMARALQTHVCNGDPPPPVRG